MNIYKKALSATKNFSDEIVSIYSPEKAYNRKSYRSQMASGLYDSGSQSSAIFQEFITSITNADSSVNYSRNIIVERSRDAIRNIPVASAITNRIVDHAVGDQGLTLHAQPDKDYLGWDSDQTKKWKDVAESIWRYFSESNESDYDRIHNIAEKTKLTLKSEIEGGDCFTLLTKINRPGSEYKLKLQSVEGEYVSNPNRLPNSEKIIDGIEKDSNGIPIKYHFSKYHPGDTINHKANKWTARNIYNSRGQKNILHHFDKIRFGQTRGLPLLSPVIGKMLQLGRLSDAELMASVLNSYQTLFVQGKSKNTDFVKKNPGEKETLTEGNDKLTLGPGTIVRVKPNTKFESFDSKRPNLSFIQFFNSIVGEIGAAVGEPRSLILMSFDKSFSASRGEILEAWITYMMWRTHIALNFCQPIYEALIDEAVMTGHINAPGYFSSTRVRRAYLGSPYTQWTGPTRPAIDELKEARAFELYNGIGTQTRQEITAKTTGNDWNKVNEQLKREKELRIQSGLEEKIE
jgi:lambda family phage portal protein